MPVRKPQIYLARHGACASVGTVLGSTDPPLTDEGRRQAAELARQVAPLGFDRIVASALRRAAETAQLVGAELNLPVETDPRLDEISYGAWDGLTWEKIERSDPETASRKLDDWWSVTPEGAESTDAFVTRLEAAWQSLTTHQASATLVVAHLGVNAVLAALARGSGGHDSGIDWARVSSFQQDHATFFAATANDLQ